MALHPGSKLGVYEVTAKIGAGGMGEVYRAHDTTLDRDVAIKVLPDAFATDPERLARFEREAKVLASLNHPNIAAIYGLEKSDDTRALILELVEGPTLQDRIAKGPIPLDEALPIARQIAEALEAAHEQGIIHRDLKPANVKVKDDGTVKVLDFGLAKALQPELSDLDAANSPTMTMTAAATKMGVIMGTAAYMSPEQARGGVADRRADVWAFGVVLYEMLTGRPLFEGQTVSDTLASVLKNDPDWRALPAALPSSIRRLLRRSLDKDRKLRLQHIGDARLEIGEADAEPVTGSDAGRTSRKRHDAALMGVTAVVTAMASGLVAWAVLRPDAVSTPAVSSLHLRLPAGSYLIDPHPEAPGRFPPIVVSPDGTRLAYAASGERDVPRLYVRALAGFDVRELPGTEGAELPFFSPGGEWVGFWVNDTLYRVSTNGGAPVQVGEVRRGVRGAVWAADDTMILGGVNRGLLQIAADGGALLEITEPSVERGDEYHAWPSLLPDGEHVLFSAVTADSSNIAVLSLSSGDWRILEGTEDATQARFLDSGHLVFFRQGGLFAAPFSPSEGVLTEPAVLVLDGLLTKSNAGHDIGYFTVSRHGTLMYVPGGTWTAENRVVSVDRAGEATPLISERGIYTYSTNLSPDGTQLAVTDNITGNGDIWVHDLTRGTRTLLSSEGSSIYPVWSADGDRVLFAGFMESSFDLYAAPADGSGERELLLERDLGQFPTSVSPDGRFVALWERNPDTGDDIHILSLDGDRATIAFLTTPASERDPSFSPDGVYLAYSSNVSGRDEVYVAAVSGAGGRTTISNNGGRWPHWSAAGDELFYISGSTMMAVSVTLEPIFEAGTAQPLFEGPFDQWYDVTPDGSFVMLTKPSAELDEIYVIQNWHQELFERVPVP